MSESIQKALVFGAGAIGTYIGGSLALSGCQVTFLERPEIAEQIRQRGLRLALPQGERRIEKPHVVSSLEAGLAEGDFDVAIFALKSFDTAAALESLRPFSSQAPPVLCLSNGVENESALAEVLGVEKVIAGTVTSAISRRGAGDIALERLRGMGVAQETPLAEKLVDAFNQAGLRAQRYPRAAEMKWSKLLTNLVGNATSAILDMTPAEIFDHPGLVRLEIQQLRETLAVMQAQGIGVVNLPATPVRLLALGVRWLPAAALRPLLRRAVGGGRGGKMPSFHIDLHSGRGKSEVDYLNGAVARFGERLGVPTPANRLLNETLLALTHRELPLETFARQPERLLQRLAAS